MKINVIIIHYKKSKNRNIFLFTVKFSFYTVLHKRYIHNIQCVMDNMGIVKCRLIVFN